MGLHGWCWDQLSEVGRDVEVLELEVDLRGERDEEHCNILAIGGRESRSVHSWPWHSRVELPMGNGEVITRKRSKVLQLLSSVISFHNP